MFNVNLKKLSPVPFSLGDSNVGKTSMFLRYTREQFDYSYQPTMNVNIGNVTKKVQFPYETLVSISLWDLPGREEIDLRRSYYKDIDAAIGMLLFFINKKYQKMKRRVSIVFPPPPPSSKGKGGFFCMIAFCWWGLNIFWLLVGKLY